MERIVAIHQPNYLPWLGYFYKIYQSDIFVFLDDVQFSNEGMHNYTYIKTPQGPFRLKYPVIQSFGDNINDVKSRDELNWKEKHLKIIESNYRRATHFIEVFNEYQELLLKDYPNISSLNSTLIKHFSGKLGISVSFVNSSDLNIDKKSEAKVISICSALGGNVYYSGTGAKSYQKDQNFSVSGIELRYSVFGQFEYPQLWNAFQANVTALDFFMNCGYDWDQVLKNQKIT
jgi:hypothetical protein